MPTSAPAFSSSVSSESNPFGTLLSELKAQPETDHRALQQHALLAFGRRTNAQPPLPVLMQDAMALVGEILHAELGGVGEVHSDRLVLSVASWDPDGTTQAPQVHRCPMDETGSMAAYTLRNGSLTVSPNLRAERRFRDTFLEGLGLAAAMVIPLHLNGKPFGVLGVYATKPREFTLDDVTFAETIAHLLSSSIARIKMEEQLHDAHALQSGVMGMVDTMVMTLDMEGRVVDMNRACEETTKYRLDDVRNQPFWSVMATPEESDLIKIIFESSRGSQIPSEFDGYVLAKDGTRRRVSWSLKVLSTGRIQTILMTGKDHTASVETRAELDKIKALAEQTTTTLNQLYIRLEEPKSAPATAAAAAASTAQSAADWADDYENPFQPMETSGQGLQQRRSPRRAYRYRQSVAPMNEGNMPAPREFFEVDCWDISACGVSFYMDRLPKFETLVVALGREPALSHFTARVMRVARIDQDDTIRYLVGCGFLGRVHLPKTRV